MRYRGYILIILLLVIFWNGLNSLVAALVVPIVCQVSDNSLLVQIAMLAFVVLLYLPTFRSRRREVSIFNNRRLTLLLLTGVWIAARLSDRYVFYGLSGCKLCYLDICLVLAGLAEIFLAVRARVLLRRSNSSKAPNASSFYPESPTEADDFDRRRCADLLIAKIVASSQTKALSRGAFTVLLNEKYGSGKTSFFNLLKKAAQDNNIVCLKYQPWLSDSRNHIAHSFFKLLETHIETMGDSVLLAQIRRYASMLSGTPYGNIVHQALGLFVKDTSIERRYDDVKDRLGRLKSPIVVLIDDADRLAYDELLSLFQLLRNSADFPNLVYIVAADKDYITNMLSNADVGSPEEFIKKFFSLEILFPALENDVIAAFEDIVLSAGYGDNQYEGREELAPVFANRYLPQIFANMRDVIRFVNLFSYNIDLLKQQEIYDEIYVPDLVRICMLQFSDNYLYRILRDDHSLLLQMEEPILLGLYKVKSDLTAAMTDIDSREMIRRISQKSDMSGDISEKKESDKQSRDIYQVIKENAPTRKDFAIHLINSMFYSSPRDARGICNVQEYFKYFSGKYRQGEFDEREVGALIKRENDAFVQRVREVVSADKYDFLIHKMSIYILEKVAEIDVVDFLEKIRLLFVEIHKRKIKSSFVNTKQFVWLNSSLRHLIGMLFDNRDKIMMSNSELERLGQYFNTGSCFADLALLLQGINERRALDRELKIPYEEIREWRNALCNRFIDTCLDKQPFEAGFFEAMVCLGYMDGEVWLTAFKGYLSDKDKYETLKQLLFDHDEGGYRLKDELYEYVYDKIPPAWLSVAFEGLMLKSRG